MISRLLLGTLLLALTAQTNPPRNPTHVESLNYPPLVRNIRVEGNVKVLARVDSSGQVIAVQSVSGHPFLKQAAEANARTWHFQSGKEEDVALNYHFKLEGEPIAGPSPSECKFDFPDSITIIVHPAAVQVNESR